MDYKKSYAKTAKEILSKPFKSKQHVCVELGITVPVFDEWLSEHTQFERSVAKGFLLGEQAAMNWLDRVAAQKNKFIDINHFWKKFERVYGVAGKDDLADNAEPVKWRVEFVESRS